MSTDLSLWCVIHHHRFGVTLGLIEADHEPSDAEAIAALDLDYEHEREERIQIEQVDTENVPRLPVTV